MAVLTLGGFIRHTYVLLASCISFYLLSYMGRTFARFICTAVYVVPGFEFAD